MINNIITLKFHKRHRCYCLCWYHIKIPEFSSRFFLSSFLSSCLSLILSTFSISTFFHFLLLSHLFSSSFSFYLLSFLSLCYSSNYSHSILFLIDIWKLKCVYFSNECITYDIITFISTFKRFNNKIVSCNRFSNDIN